MNTTITAPMSFNDDVGERIDDVRFRQQFFVNTRGLDNHSVDPFSRTHMVNKPDYYRQAFPPEANKEKEDTVETACCSRSTSTVVSGKKGESTPLENSTFFWTELRTVHPRRIRRGTDRIGMDTTENDYKR